MGSLVTVTNHRPNGNTFLERIVLVTPTGLEEVETFLGKPASPQLMLKIPCTAEVEWDTDYSSKDFVSKWKCVALGMKEIEVSAGKFKAARVRSTSRNVPTPPLFLPAVSAVHWYAPGVGIVKTELGPACPCTWLLKSFTP